MGQVKYTAQRGKVALKDVAISPGSAEAQTDTISINIDYTKIGKGDALKMIDDIARKIHATQLGLIPIVPPPALTARWAVPFNFFRASDGTATTDFNIDSVVPATEITYYWDPVNGVDAQSGLTPQLPKKTLSTIIALTAASTGHRIEFVGTADFIGRTTAGWNNTIPTKNVVLVNNTPYRVILPAIGSASTVVWTRNSTYANVYQSAFAAIFAHSVVDTTSRSIPSYIDAFGIPRGSPDVPTMFKTYTLVGSEAAVSATPGSFYHDGTNAHVRPFDDRDLTIASASTAALLVCSNGNSGRMGAFNGCRIHVENIDFVGGKPFNITNASSVTGTFFTHKHCSFQASGVVAPANALTVTSFATIYGYRSLAAFGGADGFNYHSFESDGTTPGTSPNWGEFECVQIGSGTTGSTQNSDNGSTSHDFANGVRFKTISINSDDRNIVDTNFAITWNIDVIATQAVKQQATSETFAALASAQMYLDNCRPIVRPGQTNPDYIAAQTSSLFFRNMGIIANAGTVEATGTVAAY